MRAVLRFVDRLSEWTGKLASFAIVVLTVAIGYDVFMRYLFDKPSSWIFDMTYMIYGAYTMLGAAYCHFLKGHVRMDLIYGPLSPRRKAVVDVVCYLFLFFPLFLVLVYKCGGNAVWALMNHERSHASAWRPLLAPFKLMISFGFILFLLQGIADFIRSFYFAVKGEPYEP